MSITVQPASVIYRDCSQMNISVGPTGEIFVIYSQSANAAELFHNQNGQLKSMATIRSENELREDLQGSTNFEYFALSRQSSSKPSNSSKNLSKNLSKNPFNQKFQLFDRELKLLKEIQFPNCQNLRIGSIDSKLVSLSYRNVNGSSKIKILSLPRLNSIQEIDLDGDVDSTEIFKLSTPTSTSTYLLATVSEDDGMKSNLIFYRLKKDGMMMLQTIPFEESISYTSFPINRGHLFFIGSKATKNGKTFRILKFNGERVEHMFSQKFNFEIQSPVLYPGGKYALIISGLASSRMGQLVEFDDSQGNLEILPQGFGFPLPSLAQGAFSSDGEWLVVGGGMSIEQNGEGNLILFRVEEDLPKEDNHDIRKEGSDILDNLSEEKEFKFDNSFELEEKNRAITDQNLVDKKAILVEEDRKNEGDRKNKDLLSAYSSSFDQELNQETALEVPSRNVGIDANRRKEQRKKKAIMVEEDDRKNEDLQNVDMTKNKDMKNNRNGDRNDDMKTNRKTEGVTKKDEGTTKKDENNRREIKEQQSIQKETRGLRPRQEHERHKKTTNRNEDMKTDRKDEDSRKTEDNRKTDRKDRDNRNVDMETNHQRVDEERKKKYYDLETFQSNQKNESNRNAEDMKTNRNVEGHRNRDMKANRNADMKANPKNEDNRTNYQESTSRRTLERNRQRFDEEREQRRLERRARHEEARKMREKNLKLIAGKNIIEVNSDSDDFFR